MRTPRNLDDLEIVGYANAYEATMLPTVAPPVFRLRAETDRAFVPPYFLKSGYLYNATEVTRSELLEWHGQREITLFDQHVFQARTGYELWVDQSFQPHYELRHQVESHLAPSPIALFKTPKKPYANATCTKRSVSAGWQGPPTTGGWSRWQSMRPSTASTMMLSASA